MQWFPLIYTNKLHDLDRGILQVGAALDCKFFASETPTAAVPRTRFCVVVPRIKMGQTVPSGLVKANIIDTRRQRRSVSIAIGATTLMASQVI